FGALPNFTFFKRFAIITEKENGIKFKKANTHSLPNSPDLNPIEMVWNESKKFIFSQDLKDMKRNAWVTSNSLKKIFEPSGFQIIWLAEFCSNCCLNEFDDSHKFFLCHANYFLEQHLQFRLDLRNYQINCSFQRVTEFIF
ncbi:hypothetical protein BpHYR1_028088, partial [Brachionus plicatilis]